MLDLHHLHQLVQSGAVARLSASTPSVFMVLCASAPQDGRCDLTVRDLAALSGRSQTTVIKAIRELSSAGFISTVEDSKARHHYTVAGATAPTSGATAPTSAGQPAPLAPAQPQTQSHNPPIYPPKGGPTKRETRSRQAFVVPDQHEVAAFFKANGSTGPEAGRFWNHYEANGWRVGRNPMVNWQAAARNWVSGRFQPNGRPASDPAETAHIYAPGWTDTARMEREAEEMKRRA